MRLGLIVFGIAGLMLAGCPSDSDETGSGDGSGSGEGSDSADGSGSASDSASDSQTSEGSDSAEGSGSGGDCQSLEPAQPQALELTLTNRRADPIFIGGGCGPALSLEQVGSSTLFAANTCDAPTCGAVLDGDCSTACAACLPGVLRIEPGASYTQEWAGTVFSRSEISAECSGGCVDSCWEEELAADGDYRLRSDVFVDCPETIEDCSCPEGTTPPCFIEAYDGTVNAEVREVDFALPNAGPVELFID